LSKHSRFTRDDLSSPTCLALKFAGAAPSLWRVAIGAPKFALRDRHARFRLPFTLRGFGGLAMTLDTP